MEFDILQSWDIILKYVKQKMYRLDGKSQLFIEDLSYFKVDLRLDFEVKKKFFSRERKFFFRFVEREDFLVRKR